MWSAALLILLPLAVASMVQDCSSAEDGIYGEDCSSTVTLCMNGASLDSSCPADRLFSAALGHCAQFDSRDACAAGEYRMERESRPCPAIGNWRRGDGACSPNYMVCLDGDSHTLSCPAGSFYDEAESECSTNPSDCSVEDDWRAYRGGEESPEEICYNSTSDGYHALGCSDRFVACAAGAAVVMRCPADLAYDETVQRCEYPGNVVACGGEAPEEGSGEGSGMDEGSGEGSGSEVEGSGQEGSGSEDPSETEDITSSCSNRTDGFYRLGSCASHFLGCSGGVAYRMACPASLKYDEGSQICDYPGNVDGCSEPARDSSGADGTDGSGEDLEGSGDGSGEGSGVIEGSGSEGSGAEGSGDEELIEEKETKEVIVTEDGDEEEIKEIETEDEIIVDGGHVTEKKEKIAVEEEETEASCSGRSDGFYSLGCSSEMLACSNGVATTMRCPYELVFDERNQICEHAVQVPACSDRDALLSEDGLLSGSKEAARPEISRDRTGVDATLTPSTVAPEAYKVSEKDSRCKSSNGFFSVGCSAEFVSCVDGVATTVECGEGETFDEQSRSCVPLARHPTCYQHAKQADDVIDDDVEMKKEKDDREELNKEIDHSFACSREGVFAESDCSDWFTLCERGRGIELYCVQGYLFDQKEGKCVPARQLAHCIAQ